MTKHISSSVTPEYLKRINAALALRDIPDYQAALTQLQIAVEQAPLYEVSAYLLLGLTYQDLNRVEEAEVYLRKAFELDSENVEVIQSLGSFLVQQNQYQEAISLLEPLVEDDEHNLAAHKALATALIAEGHLEDAVEVLEIAYTHFPSDGELARDLGHRLLQLERHDEAIEVLHQAIEINPNPDVLCDLSAGYALKAQYEQALDIVEQAREQFPDNDRIWRGIAYCQQKLGRFDQALQAIDQALELNPQGSRNWTTKADILKASRSNVEIIPILKKAVEVSQSSAEKRRSISKLLIDGTIWTWQQKDYTEALNKLIIDSQEFSDYELLILSLKKTLFIAEGEFAQALTTVQEAQRKGVGIEGVIWDYLRIYQGLEGLDKSQAIFRSFLNEADNKEEAVELSLDKAISFYLSGQVQLTKLIFTSILEIWPEEARVLNNLGFIYICEKEFEEAKKLLNFALKNQYENLTITQANLAYIAINETNYNLAIELLLNAQKNLPAIDQQAILHVVYWYDENISNYKIDQYPNRFRSTLLVIQANLATAYYLNNQISQAFEIARSVIETYPEDSTGYRVLGCLYFAENDIMLARANWEQALQKASKAETKILEEWINSLPSE